MSITHQIQKGDNLTKIAKQYYGLTGSEAYAKALEIAKANNIENANLIYAGQTLQLFDTPEEKEQQKETEANTGTGDTLQAGGEGNFETTYQELMTKQQALYKQLNSAIYGNEDNSGYNSETDRYVAFAAEDTFADDATKLDKYKEAILALAQEDIQANDQEDENGEKDSKLSLEEFTKSQMAFYEAAYADSVKYAAKEAFITQYKIENEGREPSAQEINEAVEQEWQTQYDMYSTNIAATFESYDIDGSGFLEDTEIATTYAFMDAAPLTNSTKKLSWGDNYNKIEFDGVIDLENIMLPDKGSMEELHNTFFKQNAAA